MILDMPTNLRISASVSRRKPPGTDEVWQPVCQTADPTVRVRVSALRPIWRARPACRRAWWAVRSVHHPRRGGAGLHGGTRIGPADCHSGRHAYAALCRVSSKRPAIVGSVLAAGSALVEGFFSDPFAVHDLPPRAGLVGVAGRGSRTDPDPPSVGTITQFHVLLDGG